MATPGPITLTPKLCRAARAMVGWGQEDLSKKSGVPKPTISAFETKPDVRRLATLNAKAIISAFEEAGLEFIPENGGGGGVRYQKRLKDRQDEEAAEKNAAQD